MSRYAIRENTSRVKIFKNFKEKKSFKPEFGAEGIYGGHLLSVTSGSHLSFYDWESQELIRRVEISVKHVSTYTHSHLSPLTTLTSYTHHPSQPSLFTPMHNSHFLHLSPPTTLTSYTYHPSQLSLLTPITFHNSHFLHLSLLTTLTC